MEDSNQSNDAKIQEYNEKNLLDFSLYYNKEKYNCSLIEIENKYLKFKATFENEKYEAEFSFNDFLDMNKNFKIYDDLKELENDLVSYIKQDHMSINIIQDNILYFHLKIVAKSNNFISLKLNKIEEIKEDKEKEDDDTLDYNNDNTDYFIGELKVKSEEIKFLKNKLNQMQDENKKNLDNKKNIIDNLKTRIEKLEEKFAKIKSEELSVNNYLEENNNLIQKYIKLNNIMELQKEYKTIKTKNPVNEICIFPESGNYLESSGPKIYDKEHNLLKSLDDIGCCDHICLVCENSVILSQKNKLILLKITNHLQNSYSYEFLNINNWNCGNITKIIRDKKDGCFIVSDDIGNIYFLEMTFSFKINLRIKHTISSKYKGNTNIFLFKEYLIIAMNYLYIIKRDEAENYKEINLENYIRDYVQPSGFNSIICINENLNLIGVGCKTDIYILKIDEKGDTNIELTYSISKKEEDRFIDALCLYQNNILIAGDRAGNLYFYHLEKYSNDFKKIIEKVHQYNKDSDTAISGIIEFPDGSFATYGGDKKIKIWYI